MPTGLYRARQQAIRATLSRHGEGRGRRWPAGRPARALRPFPALLMDCTDDIDTPDDNEADTPTGALVLADPDAHDNDSPCGC